MAISTVFSPDPLSLTRGGRCAYRFQGDGRVVAAGTAAINGFVITGPLAEGNSITMQWGEKTETLTIRNNPAEPGELPAGNGGSAHADAIADYLSQYQPFREDFTVFRSALNGVEGVNLTARRQGERYNIRQLSQSGNWSAGNALAGQDEIIRERYSIYVELFVARPGLDGSDPDHFDRIYAATIDTDADGYADFDCGSMLHSHLSADLPLFEQAIGKVNTLSARPYYVAYGEAWGSPLKVALVTEDSVKRAYLGGADYLNAAGDGFSLSQPGGIQPSVSRALRFGPRRRYVRLNEPSYLTFINFHSPLSAVGLSVRLLFDDNTTLTRTDLVEELPYPAGAKLTFATGFNALGLAELVPAGKYLKEYFVVLHHGESDYSAEYRYTIDYAFRPYTRYFIYLNSLGAFDTLTTYGKGSAELSRVSELAESVLPLQYSVTDGQFAEYDVQLQQQYEVATGFRPESFLTRCTDFYRSPVKFLLLPSREVLPVGLLSKSIKQAKDGDTLFAHSFSFQFLYQDMFFTDNDEFDEGPPPGFSGVGTITVEQTQVVAAVDNTVPAAARQLTTEDLSYIRQISAISAAAAGKLSPSAADLLFPRKGTVLTRAEADLSYLQSDAVSPDAPLQVGGLSAPFSETEEADGLLAYTKPAADSEQKEIKVIVYDKLKDILTDLLGLDDFVKSGDAGGQLEQMLTVLISRFGINQVLEAENKAVIPLLLMNGGLLTGKGKDADNKEIRVKMDLDPAPVRGSYGVPVIEENSKNAFFMALDDLRARLAGDVAQTPTGNPGPPVAVVIPEIVISSGEDLNTVLPAFTKADGTPYPYTIAYALKGQPSGFSFTPAFRRLTGNKTVNVETTWPLVLEGIVGEGLQEGTKVSTPFNLRVLAAVATQLPKPSIAPISAINATQGQSLTVNLTVTWPDGVTPKAGKFRATVALPTGVSVNENSGVISGTPVSAGSFSATIEFTDVDGQKDEITFQVIVAAAPLSVNILAATYTWDVNTQAATWFFKLQNVTKAELGVQTPGGIVRLGQYNGKALSTDPASADFRLTLEAGSFQDGHNWKGGFYPFGLSPLNGGLGKGEKEKLFLWLNDSGTPTIFWVITDPSVNKGLTPLLTTEPTGGGTSTGNPPIPPAVDPQSVTVGQAFRHEFRLFTDQDAGDVVTYPAISGAPAGITAEFDGNAQKLVVRGAAQQPGTFRITFVGQDPAGNKGYLYIDYTAVAVTNRITAIDRKIIINGSNLSVIFSAYAEGSAGVEMKIQLGAETGAWFDAPRGSDGAYGIGAGPLPAGTILRNWFRIKGQTSEIMVEYTVLTPIPANIAGTERVWPAAAPAIGYTERIISTWTIN